MCYNHDSAVFLPLDIPSELKDRALASATEGITISDPSLPDNPLIYVNSGFEAITGYKAGEVLGRNCRFLQGPHTGQPEAEKIRRAIAEDRPCVVQLLNYRKDGSTFWNRLSITPVRDDAGKTTHYIGVISDITRRKEAEDSLRKANQQLATANKMMKRAINYAVQIQSSMLPPPITEGDRYTIAASRFACEELAGDTLNYFQLDEHRVGFYVLDVVGHGVPAALMSVTINRLLSPRSGKSCLYESAGPEQKAARILAPAQVCRMLNEMFSENVGTGQFFTIFYGIWDASTDKLSYCSAGHPPGVYVPAGGEAVLLKAEGFPIGVHSDPEYRTYTQHLSSGDRLFIYSDGLTDAMDGGKNQFGLRRLLAHITEGRSMPLADCLNSIFSSVKRFGTDLPSRDDMSLLGFEITGYSYVL